MFQKSLVHGYQDYFFCGSEVFDYTIGRCFVPLCLCFFFASWVVPQPTTTNVLRFSLSKRCEKERYHSYPPILTICPFPVLGRDERVQAARGRRRKTEPLTLCKWALNHVRLEIQYSYDSIFWSMRRRRTARFGRTVWKVDL